MANAPYTTHREYELREDDFLISRTDLKGYITYANPAFVEVSGFTYDELLGANHNLVRHPDMPAAAFGNLWSTVKAGQLWHGLVMNRRKNGEFYWVDASVVPYYENGAHVGYASIRVRPSREMVALATETYRAMREGRASMSLDRGRLVHGGLRGRLERLQLGSMKARLSYLAAACTLSLLGSGWLALENMPVAQWAVIGGGSLLVALLSVATARAVLRPSAEAVSFLEQMSAGNVAVRMRDVGHNELGELARMLDTLRKSLMGIAMDIRGSVETVAQATRSMADSNLDLAARTEQQAAALQETAASMEEITSTVEQSAHSARQASTLSGDAVQSVEQSGAAMGDVVATMERITAGAAEMHNVIATIEGLAFQTNLLALNASIEAAKAGEQGSGFAVIAREVRTLARRTASATEEIRGLIEASGTVIDSGADQVRQAEEAMREVVGAVSRLNGIMGEIASASNEQSLGISQVSQAIVQMDRVTQENAALVQTSSHVAGQLDAQGVELNRSMDLFCGVPQAAPRSAAAQGGAGHGQGHSASHAATSRPAASKPRPAPVAQKAASEDDWESF
ncbi:PAS domain-containing methyl-accepting chemotaxis protein [Pseudomonas sp. NW5]|uniref:methyl-accepting chemotaxis protein n=1 Tax=Pseudomonas sp. NW5 TaxID=2934934 RepID=UPI00201FB95D|nr:PAS domain-containing methyl-accepting chemotaxis protein [Pseudomonas sp. NW5]MCL7462349.1 methyl-accepting chemotaxis protein [Pseudomonas sp. NW5]